MLIAAPFDGEGGRASDDFALMSVFGVRLPPDVRVDVRPGLQDDTVPPLHAELNARAIPQAQVDLLPGRDHQLNNDLSEVAEAISIAQPWPVIRAQVRKQRAPSRDNL